MQMQPFNVKVNNNKQCSCLPDFQRQNLGHRCLDSCSVHNWGYTRFFWISAPFGKPFCCVRYFCATSRDLQHLHFGFWIADSHFHLWTLVGQELGLEWYCCGFHVCPHRRHINTSEFAKHPRHSKVSCGSRDHLQSNGFDIPVSNTH